LNTFQYSTCYNEEVDDWYFLTLPCMTWSSTKKKRAECWRDSVETYLTAEKTLQEKQIPRRSKRSRITYDFALCTSPSGQQVSGREGSQDLLERGLIEPMVSSSTAVTFVYLGRFITCLSCRGSHGMASVFENLKPTCSGSTQRHPRTARRFLDDAKRLIDQIRKVRVERQAMHGGHHFHLLQPEETAKMVWLTWRRDSTLMPT